MFSIFHPASALLDGRFMVFESSSTDLTICSCAFFFAVLTAVFTQCLPFLSFLQVFVCRVQHNLPSLLQPWHVRGCLSQMSHLPPCELSAILSVFGVDCTCAKGKCCWKGGSNHLLQFLARIWHCAPLLLPSIGPKLNLDQCHFHCVMAWLDQTSIAMLPSPMDFELV